MQLAKERRWVRFADLEFDFEHETTAVGAGTGGDVNQRTYGAYTITATGGLNNDASYNAEYVDVVHDGIHRTTGSSMDLGSISFAGSTRGPGSFTGSLGRSPRSPLSGIAVGGTAAAAAGAGAGGGAGGGAAGADDQAVVFKVGSAPSASTGVGAAAGGAASGRQGSTGSSRLRPTEGAVNGGFHAVVGSNSGAPAASAPQQTAAGAAAGGTAAERRRAVRELSSFSVRISHEGGFSDAGDGDGAPLLLHSPPSEDDGDMATAADGASR